MKLEDIRDFLGHDDIISTEVYTELTKEDIREMSHIAYAYPKSYLGMQKTPKIEVTLNTEALILQKEILEKQLELAKIKMNEGYTKMEEEYYASTPQY